VLNAFSRVNFDRIQNVAFNTTGRFPNQKLTVAPGFVTATTSLNPRNIQLAPKIIFQLVVSLTWGKIREIAQVGDLPFSFREVDGQRFRVTLLGRGRSATL